MFKALDYYEQKKQLRPWGIIEDTLKISSEHSQ